MLGGQLWYYLCKVSEKVIFKSLHHTRNSFRWYFDVSKRHPWVFMDWWNHSSLQATVRLCLVCHHTWKAKAPRFLSNLKFLSMKKGSAYWPDRHIWNASSCVFLFVLSLSLLWGWSTLNRLGEVNGGSIRSTEFEWGHVTRAFLRSTFRISETSL